MGMRLIRELQELVRAWPLTPRNDDAARLDLAASAHRFSRRTRRVVDDKLAFSATLMRAGEVEAANRLLAEVHDEVRTEGAALIERINEAKVTVHTGRQAMTRIRLARTMAVAMLGASLTAFSAAGVAVVNAIDDDAPQVAVPVPERRPGSADQLSGLDRGRRGDGRTLQRIRIGGKQVALTQTDLRLVEQIASGVVTPVSVSQILDLLPPAVRDAIERSARNRRPDEVADMLLRAVKNKKRKDRPERPAPQPSPSPSPSEEPEPEPSEQPTPSPSPSPSSENKKKGSGGGGGNKEDNNDSGNQESPGSSDEPDEGPLGPLD